ncbi:hypothetical protein FDB44_11740 [Clostridium botulinum]|uniref:hypothetical protein n=1 Tax=Clostridium botulinum TaxID=1491 RepID=UPI0013F112BB|nr:hypothetical protein [Clostridium botulinum]MBY6935600.1 hypothetical protein [Clostridium botulinum]NFL84299.1 hypothetical protein [Clostridium botulinum]NFN12909.1 hypothetical protein [Clostridium botulinum]NFO38031.1 hypothetical protein [Clostridium botulinum]NFO44849.1 hypothetical protein [Clostridium botulinum]
MEIMGNPADRLYKILIDAKGICNSCSYVKNVWASIFDIDEVDQEKVFLSVVQVVEHIETIKKVAMRIQSSKRDDFIKEITGLERQIMNIKLTAQASELRDIINEKRLMSLQAIALGLDTCSQYSNIEEETLVEYKETILELINETNDLSINDNLKKVIIENLNQVDIMINEYKLYGLEGIKSAVENGYGKIMLDRQLSEELRKDVTLKETIFKILNLFGNINTVVTFTKNVGPMLTEASEIAKNFFLN